MTRRIDVTAAATRHRGDEQASVIDRVLSRNGQRIAHLSSEVPVSAELLHRHDVSSIGLYRALDFLKMTPRRVTTTQSGKRIETATHRYLAEYFSVRSTLLQ